LHENSYQPLNLKQIEQYDQTMNDYYQARSTNTKQQGWSEQICSKLSQESRPFILDYLNKKGLAKK
ncbi:oxygen-insensitive NADPH nitroreductase, partial [Vibrio cincinnatiensis]